MSPMKVIIKYFTPTSDTGILGNIRYFCRVDFVIYDLLPLHLKALKSVCIVHHGWSQITGNRGVVFDCIRDNLFIVVGYDNEMIHVLNL